MNLIKEFLRLPKYVQWEDVEFTPKITHEGKQIYIVYEIFSVQRDSKHRSDYDQWGCINFKGSNQSFLIVAQNIETQQEFKQAIDFILKFLKKHNLLNK